MPKNKKPDPRNTDLLKMPPGCKRFEMLPLDVPPSGSSALTLCFDGTPVHSMRPSTKPRQDCAAIALQYWRLEYWANGYSQEIDDQETLWTKFGGWWYE